MDVTIENRFRRISCKSDYIQLLLGFFIMLSLVTATLPYHAIANDDAADHDSSHVFGGLPKSDRIFRRSLTTDSLSTNQERISCANLSSVFVAGGGLFFKISPKFDGIGTGPVTTNGNGRHSSGSLCASNNKAGSTCCSPEMERRLITESRSGFKKLLQDKIVGLLHTFEYRTAKFDKFFRALLAKARQDLHNMFVRTYGMLYEQNSDIFAQLFDQFTAYYVGSRTIDLDDQMDRFYKNLFQRMFRLLNQPYQFDTTYFDCMDRHMNALKPFGDVPDKMKQQISRSFIAAKTFVSELSAGRDAIRQMMEFTPTDECSSAVTRLAYCQYCNGLSTTIKPCINFCLNVMKGCLYNQAEIDSDWNAYLASLTLLLERLEGPFNIELVIDPISVKISEAIMTFQERGREITDKIFTGCGTPQLGTKQRLLLRRRRRRRRNVKEGNEYDVKSLTYINPSPPPAPTTAAGISLDRLSKDIREKIVLAKGFWLNLPQNLCQDERLLSNQDDLASQNECWNGSARARYRFPLSDDGLQNQRNNPELKIAPRYRDPIVVDQIQKLKFSSTKMRKAYDGHATVESTGRGNFSQSSPSPSKHRLSPSNDADAGSGDEFSGDGEDPDVDQQETTAEKIPPDLQTDDEDLLRSQARKNGSHAEDRAEEYSGDGPVFTTDEHNMTTSSFVSTSGALSDFTTVDTIGTMQSTRTELQMPRVAADFEIFRRPMLNNGAVTESISKSKGSHDDIIISSTREYTTRPSVSDHRSTMFYTIPSGLMTTSRDEVISHATHNIDQSATKIIIEKEKSERTTTTALRPYTLTHKSVRPATVRSKMTTGRETTAKTTKSSMKPSVHVSIEKNLVDHHGGHIVVENNDSKKSGVTVVSPKLFLTFFSIFITLALLHHPR